MGLNDSITAHLFAPTPKFPPGIFLFFQSPIAVIALHEKKHPR